MAPSDDAAKLQTLAHEVANQNAALQARIRNLEGAVSTRNDEIYSLKNRIYSKDDEIDGLEERLDEAEAELVSVKDERDERTQRLIEVEADRDNLLAQLRRSENRAALLQQQVNQAPYSWAIKQRDDLKAKVDDLNNQLADALLRGDELTDKLHEANRKLRESGEKVDRLALRNADLAAQLESEKRANENLIELKNRPRPETVRRELVVKWRDALRRQGQEAAKMHEFATLAINGVAVHVLNEILTNQEPRTN
jgi:chromosome segregation ATPase